MELVQVSNALLISTLIICLKLQKMYESWPFFRSLLSNVDMVLSKSNMNIAFEYAKMCESEEVRNIFHVILDEWQLTKEIILSIEQMMSF